MITFLNKVIKYYSQRIKLLSGFIKAARLSLKGIKNNLLTPDEFKTKASHLPNMMKLIKFFVPKQVKYNKNIAEKLIQMRTCNANADFDTYRKLYKEVVEYAGINDGDSFVATISSFIDPDYFLFQILKVEYETIEIGSKPLYHQAHQPDITELKPTAMSNGGLLFHRTGRVYFHVAVPLNRYNARVDKNMVFNGALYQGNYEKGNVYKATGISKAYKDPELGRSAVFVETDKPIPVEHVDWDQYKADLEKYFDIKPKEEKE